MQYENLKIMYRKTAVTVTGVSLSSEYGNVVLMVTRSQFSISLSEEVVM